ncbi:hypothetical protein [Winogradskyella sp.]|uniref:hypothetical protein n=1 Tax=Winogradskyella sp. TaxID=1883156 RepID=UPI003BA918D3
MSLKIKTPSPFNVTYTYPQIAKLIGILVLFLLSYSNVQAQEVFEVKFKVGFTQYRGALVVYDGGYGKMRVRYYRDGRTRMVEQSMKVEKTLYGMKLNGHNPVYPGTSTAHPSYNADNFYISIHENGNYSIISVDDDGTAAAQTTIRLIKGKYTTENFLDDFNWTLNSKASYRNIYFKNACGSDIKLALRYRYNGKDWTTKSWYHIDGNEKTYLSSNGIKLSTENSIVYVYAYTPYNTHKWSGDDSRYIDGKLYKMRKYEMEIDADGDYYIDLNCNSQ